MTATVQAIDLEKRLVTLKGPKGEKKTIAVGPEARNLPQLKVGDLVTVKYYESMAVEVIKPGDATGAGQSSAIVRAKPGERPGGMATRTATVTATVTAIDKKKGTVTLKGPEGNLVTAKAEDPKNLDKIKVGDELLITYHRGAGNLRRAREEEIDSVNARKRCVEWRCAGSGFPGPAHRTGMFAKGRNTSFLHGIHNDCD